MKTLVPLAVATITAFASLGFAPIAEAHCQIPCGIYDDDNVIQSMHTDSETITKACAQIVELQKDPKTNAQQIVRWVTNKESHAQAVQEKVLNYFLAQRLKADQPDEETYMKNLKLCHQVIVTAMACKQSTDAANAEKLHDLLVEFQKAFGSKE
ncbi:superoxide dismutase [Ni] [Haloferula chungangensis]|uniref:Superoxide dismutase [Ni] n=1 Tax=Haloferula chungangensis TaxID=1048331 RepID=A0ABW2L1L0_9BACT